MRFFEEYLYLLTLLYQLPLILSKIKSFKTLEKIVIVKLSYSLSYYIYERIELSKREPSRVT